MRSTGARARPAPGIAAPSASPSAEPFAASRPRPSVLRSPEDVGDPLLARCEHLLERVRPPMRVMVDRPPPFARAEARRLRADPRSGRLANLAGAEIGRCRRCRILVIV